MCPVARCFAPPLRPPLVALLAALAVAGLGHPPPATAQMGGAGGGGAQAPEAEVRPKFRDHIHLRDGIALRREDGDQTIGDVRVTGLSQVSRDRVDAELQTRAGRVYDPELILGDIRRLNDLRSFDHVTYRVDPMPPQPGDAPDGPDRVRVVFFVHERPLVQEVHFHGNRGVNDGELAGRVGINVGDPLNEFAAENARLRIIDFYREKGFNQVAVATSTGLPATAKKPERPQALVFRINEGPRERIWDIDIEGSTIVSEAQTQKSD